MYGRAASCYTQALKKQLHPRVTGVVWFWHVEKDRHCPGSNPLEFGMASMWCSNVRNDKS